MKRRLFLKLLAVGIASLQLKFRPESVEGRYHPPQEFLNSGYVFTPYFPIYTTREIGAEDFRATNRFPGYRTKLHPSERIRKEKYGGYENSD